MKTYLVYEVVKVANAFEVDANSEEAAEQKLENAGFIENSEVSRLVEYDQELSRRAQCDGEK